MMTASRSFSASRSSRRRRTLGSWAVAFLTLAAARSRLRVHRSQTAVRRARPALHSSKKVGNKALPRPPGPRMPTERASFDPAARAVVTAARDAVAAALVERRKVRREGVGLVIVRLQFGVSLPNHHLL